MKKSRVLVFLLVLAVMASPLFAGGSSSGSSSGSGPVKLSIYNPGRPDYRPDLPNIQEIMKRTNTEIEVIIGENTDALNLLFASGDLPDILKIGNLDYQNYVHTGYLRPLDDLLKNHAPNLMKYTSPDAWQYLTVNGKIYAYPYENNLIKLYTYVREDYIRNLGIDLSKNADYGDFGGKVVTLNEFRNILEKITNGDPTKTGKKVYGLAGQARMTITQWSNIFGAHGGIPAHYYATGNSVVPWSTTNEFRQGLQYINGLWRDGLIDPEVYLQTGDQGKQKMINSVSGAGTGGWWSDAHTLMIDGLHALNPDAEYIPLRLTSNDGKFSGAPDNGLCSQTTSITTQCKNPEKAMEFLDFLSSDDGWYLTWVGLPDLDFTFVDGYATRTPVGQEKYNAMIIDVFFSITNRLSLQNHFASAPKTDWTGNQRRKWEILQMDNTQPKYTSLFYGIPAPTAYLEMGVDVNNWIEQSSMAFITGERALNDANWNEYINTWKRMGGVKILQGYLDAYKNLRGGNYIAGISE